MRCFAAACHAAFFGNLECDRFFQNKIGALWIKACVPIGLLLRFVSQRKSLISSGLIDAWLVENSTLCDWKVDSVGQHLNQSRNQSRDAQHEPNILAISMLLLLDHARCFDFEHDFGTM